MSSTKRLFALALTLTASFSSIATGAAPERPRVLVLDSEIEAPQGFVDALRIQAAGVAEVSHAGKVTGTLGEKVATVDGPLRDAGASVGIWVERVTSESDESEFLVYLVARRKSRVLVEVVRLPGGESPETDRALAIKVRDVLDAILAGSAEPDVAQPMIAPIPGEKPEPPPARAKSPFSFLLQAGLVGVSAGNGSTEEQLGGALGVGVRHRGNGWLAEALLAGWLLSGTESENARRRVQTRELELAASFRALLAAEGWAAGAHLGVATRFVDATGTANDGRSGSALRVVPLLRLGPELRAALGTSVDLRAAGGLDLALRRQRFAVTGEEIVDLGSVRGSAELGLVVSLP